MAAATTLAATTACAPVFDKTATGTADKCAAYAVAAKMNYANLDVRWVRVSFNAALAPGPKTFDANLSEFSITDQRKAAVDFS